MAIDENTVFNNAPPTSPTPPVSPAPEVLKPAPISASPVVAPKMEPAPILPPKSTNIPPIPPPGSPLQPPSISKSFLSSKILKIGGLVAVLVIIAVMGIMVIMPWLNNRNTEEVTLSYWGLWENENVINSVIADFEKENPNIKVKYEKRDIKQYRETVTTRVPNGNGPDIYKIHNTWLPMFSSLLLPLSNDVITKEDFKKNYYPVAQKDFIKSGAIYALPSDIDVLAMYVNKDIFSAAGIEVPTTWDTFAATSRKLTVKNELGKIKTAGAALGTYDNIGNAPDIISLLFAQNGADIHNLQSTPQNGFDALTFYTSFTQDNINVWDETLDNARLMFIKGDLAMYFGYSWDIFSIKAANPNLPFEIFPVPHLVNRNMTIASYWADGVSAKSTHPKEAMLFLKFLAKKETQQKIFSEASKTRLFGQPYARVDLGETLKDNQYLYPFISQAKDATSSFFAANTYDNGLNTQMNAYLGNAVRAIGSNNSTQSVLETLSQGVAQILRQYGQ